MDNLGKRALVWALYWSCWALDRFPCYVREDRRWYRHQLGCSLGVAQRAADLETRWRL